MPARFRLSKVISLQRTWAGIVLLLSAWVLWAAFVTNIEYSDGYITIANSHYLAGHIAEYFGQRGPFLAIWLIPASWLSQQWQLQPLDIRLHHLSVAVLHIGYLVTVIYLLSASRKKSLVALMAFLATIPGFVFFSYAPFISHDLFPGALLLVMLLLADKFVGTPNWRALTLLVCLGYVAAITKHIYGLFWITIIVAYAWILFRRKRSRRSVIIWCLLLLGAGISGIATWLTYAWALSGSIPEVPFLLRPYYQMLAVYSAYAGSDPSEIFAWWLYWRNFPLAYGVLTSLLIIPGLCLSLRSHSRFQRSVAISWLICFVAMNLMVFKEVRYLAYLAPLSAFLLIPVIRFLWFYCKTSHLRWLLLLLIALDLSKGVTAVYHMNQDFYQNHGMQQFLQAIEQHPRANIVITNVVSLTPGNGYSPLRGDRYHRLFHVTDEIIRRLYRTPAKQIRLVSDLSEINETSCGELLIFSSTALIRLPGEFAPLSERPLKHVQFVAMAGSNEQTGLAGRQVWLDYDGHSAEFSWKPEPVGEGSRVFTVLTPRSSNH